ncbi:MAG: hypothetical protein Q9165_000550 [Trypethelium subeluteriae]
MPPILTATEVRSKSKTLSLSIFNSWNSLKATFERHEATIRKRWLRRTREQRKKILLAAWPDMSIPHRPDFDTFKKKKKARAAFMWPYVNVDDLSKPKLFLILLNARARNQPYLFARADIDACRFGIISDALVPGFLGDYVMMFTGRTDAVAYGELIAWDDHPHAFHWFSFQHGAHPGEGLLILEIQERLYKFLTDCCKEILRDMSDTVLTGLDAPPQPESPSISSNDLGLGSIASSITEAPYRVLAELNLEHLESIVEAKLLSAQDHVWALREDPGYFATVLQEYKDHRQETMLDVDGKKHPLLAIPTKECVFRERVINNSIVATLADVEFWGVLLDKVFELRRLARKYATEIDPERDLPEEYAFAFYTLYYHLSACTRGTIDSLKHGFVASPPLRPYFSRQAQDPDSTVICVVRRTDLKGEVTRDAIMWVFMTLFDEQQLHLAGLSTLMDELERLQGNEPKAKELISPWVEGKISDLAILSHCRHQIELYQPWAASFADQMVMKRQDILNDFLHTQGLLDKYTDTEIGPSAVSLAENNLDEFWREVDRKFDGIYASSPRVRAMLSERTLERTPEWAEPVKATEANALGTNLESLVKPLSELRFDPENSKENTTGRDCQQLAKVKSKTRGTPSAQPSSIPVVQPRIQPDQQPTYPVDKRAFKVFKTIFYRPSASSQPGEIAWQDFIHALCSTCFVAEKLYGSVWQFSPKGLDVDRSIHFHKPHPSGKIPFLMARRHGRRLNRTFGWDGNMFVLAS